MTTTPLPTWTRCPHDADLITRTVDYRTICTGCGWTHHLPPGTMGSAIAIAGLHPVTLGWAIGRFLEGQ